MNTNVSTQLVITEKALKRHTKRLQQEMLQFKEDFKLSEAQNMLAKIFGTKDFNELNTLIKHNSNNPEDILDIKKDMNVIPKINTVPLPEYSQKAIDYLANFKPAWEKQFANHLDEINKKYLNMLSEIYYHFSYLYSSEDSKIQHLKNKQKIWDLLEYAILNQNIINFDLFNKEGYNLLELVLTVDLNSPFILTLIDKTCVDKHLYQNKNVLYIALFKRKANKKNINAILKKIKRETLLENNLYKDIINLMYFMSNDMFSINKFLEKININNIDYNSIIDNTIIIDQLVIYANSKKHYKRYNNIFNFLKFLLENNYKLPENISSCLLKNANYNEKDIARCLAHFENQSKIKQNHFKKSLIEHDKKIKTVIKDISSIHNFKINEELLQYINKYN